MVHAVEDLHDVLLSDLANRVGKQRQTTLKLLQLNHAVLVLINFTEDASAIPHFLRRHDRVGNECVDLELNETLLF